MQYILNKLFCQEEPQHNFFRRCIVAFYSFYSASPFGKDLKESLKGETSPLNGLRPAPPKFLKKAQQVTPFLRHKSFFFLNSKLRYGCSYKASSENVPRQTYKFLVHQEFCEKVLCEKAYLKTFTSSWHCFSLRK